MIGVTVTFVLVSLAVTVVTLVVAVVIAVVFVVVGVVIGVTVTFVFVSLIVALVVIGVTVALVEVPFIKISAGLDEAAPLNPPNKKINPPIRPSKSKMPNKIQSHDGHPLLVFFFLSTTGAGAEL